MDVSMVDDGGPEFPMGNGNGDLDAILFDGAEDPSVAPVGLEADGLSAILDSPGTSLDHDATKPAGSAEEVTLMSEALTEALAVEQEHPAASENSSQTDSPMEPPSNFTKNDEAELLALASEDPSCPRPLNFEIPLYSLPPDFRMQYETVQSDIVDFIIEELPDAPNESLYRLEYTDGTQDTLTYDELARQPGGQSAYQRFYDKDHLNMGPAASKKRRRSEADAFDSESLADDLAESDEEISSRASQPKRLRLTSRRSTRETTQIFSDDDEEVEPPKPKGRELHQRQSRLRALSKFSHAKSYAEDEDELARDLVSDGDDDDNFLLVTSDLAPKGGRPRNRNRRLKLRSSNTAAPASSRGSSIEFEDSSRRRSGRSTRNQKSMIDTAYMDDESFYLEDNTTPGAPRVVGVREIFKVLPPDSDFPSFHEDICKICTYGPVSGKGQLIGCQGCSFSFHKSCLGARGPREHLATKVGSEDFVLQCKWCIGLYRKRDKTAPTYESCQECEETGKSCISFSEKLTPRQEEKLRQENDGEDPVTAVAPDLLNNPSNVLFRCTACNRAWHFEHLSSPKMQSDIASIRDQRLTEYSVDWKCQDCGSRADKAQTLVAWRPNDISVTDAAYDSLSCDKMEYLVKWQDKSYHHCSWMAGAWVYGVIAGAMKKAFAKKNATENLLKLNTQDAIPEEYLLIDVILQTKGGKTLKSTKEEELRRISQVKQVYVKFQGLGYDEVVWDSPPPTKSESQYEAFKSAYQEYLNGKYFDTKLGLKMKERLRTYKDDDFVDPVGQPLGIKRGKLMEYQMEGVAWMLYNYHQDRNVILADEMGLGKTVQVISLIAQLALDGPQVWPWMVVVPNSTCPNWRREIKFWAPDLRVVTYHGGKRPQELAYKYELFPEGSKDMKAHIVVMSYDSAQDDRTRHLFRSVQWAGLVVDEGQRLKNDQNLLYGALKAMKFPFRLLLTGTPLQNNKRELFNLLQFIDPSHNAAALDEQYGEINASNLPELHEKLRPYFLRRTKAAVLKFLPPMAQIILPVSMSVLQEKLSKSIMAKNPELLKAIFGGSKLRPNERGSLNNILVQLRKCLCHPFMYSEAIEERGVDALTAQRNLVSASSKLVLLEQMLPKLKERGHRVLLFSQFLNQLDILEDFLNDMGLEHRRLDGSISSLEKQKRIDAFNAPDSSIFAFLLSTRAGGVGINLATADTVIILDPDFNPHQDIQALSRAHRIGQKSKVLCFQLVTKHTVEEKIMQIGRKKMALDHVLIESMDNEDEAPDDLESILKFGASALFGEGTDDKEVIRYDDASIDKLLDRSEMEQTKTDDDGSTNFSFARVWANDRETLDNNLAEHEDPTVNMSVWDDILREREEEAKRIAAQNVVVLGRGGRRRQNINYRTNQAVEADENSGSDVDEDFKDSGDEREDDEEEVAGDVDAEEVSALSGTNKRKVKDLSAMNSTPAQNASARPTPSGPKGSKSKSKEKAERPKKTVDQSQQPAPAPPPVSRPMTISPVPIPQIPRPNASANRPQNVSFRPAQYQRLPPSIPPHLAHLYRLQHPATEQDRLRQQFATLSNSLSHHPRPPGAAPQIQQTGQIQQRSAMPLSGLPAQHQTNSKLQAPSSRITIDLVKPRSDGRANGSHSTQSAAPPARPPATTGQCPLCGERHAPSTCPQIKKERHIRLALDGLARWASDPREIAAEKIALKRRLRDLM